MNNLSLDFSKDSIQFAKQEFITLSRFSFKASKSQGFPSCQTTNKEFFSNAVWQGYLDTCRTMRGIKNADTERAAFSHLADELKKYFGCDSEVFNHDEWCNNLVDDLIKYNNNTEKTFEPRYGQAQKIVNMAFKYLYCCEGAEEYKSKFEPCHMPLDQYTLLWYFTETGILYKHWSYFEKEKYKEVQTDVVKIKNQICREYGSVTVLDIELVVWNKMRKSVVSLKEF